MLSSPQLLAEIESFLRRSGMGASYFGQKVANNSKLVPRLRAGGSVKLERAAQILAFMKEQEMRATKRQKG